MKKIYGFKNLWISFIIRKDKIIYKGYNAFLILNMVLLLIFIFMPFEIVPVNMSLKIAAVFMACLLVLFGGLFMLERFCYKGSNRSPVYYVIYEVFGEGSEKEERLIMNYAYHHEVMNFVLERKDLERKDPALDDRQFKVVEINELRAPEKKEKKIEAEDKDYKKALKELDREFPGTKPL